MPDKTNDTVIATVMEQLMAEGPQAMAQIISALMNPAMRMEREQFLGALFTGKDSTFGIEQDNSNIRHYLARFRRRAKVSSCSREMVDLSLRLLHHLREPENFLRYQQVALSIFG